MNSEMFGNNKKPHKRRGFELSNRSLTNLVLISFVMVAITMGTVLYDQFIGRDVIVPSNENDAAVAQAIIGISNQVNGLTESVEELTEEFTNAGTNVSRSTGSPTGSTR